MSARVIFGLAACLLFCGSVNAALVSSLKFRDPVGTANPTDIIDVWATLSLAEESDPLALNWELEYPFGLLPSNFPSLGRNWQGDLVPFAVYNYIGRWSLLVCSGTFFDGCGRGENYEFKTAFFPPEDGISLAAGESVDLLIGSFVPSVWGARPGNYTFYNFELHLSFSGFDAEGSYLESSIMLGATCPDFSTSCAFTRTVVSDVPAPAAALLFASGLGLLGGTARRARLRQARGI